MLLQYLFFILRLQITTYTDICSHFKTQKEEQKMLISQKNLLFVAANRIQGTNKTGNPYDFANIELSDGIGSLEMPLEPHLAEQCNQTFGRGQEVKIVVDARKQFGRTQFIVKDVLPAQVK